MRQFKQKAQCDVVTATTSHLLLHSVVDFVEQNNAAMTLRFLRSLTGRHRTLSANLQMGMSLAFIAGAINAAGFLAFAFYTSHMTGIVSAIADNIVLGQMSLVIGGSVAVTTFVLGAMTSTLLINWARRNRMHSEYALSLLLEAFLLMLFAVQGRAWSSASALFFPFAALLLCFIMGLQNAVATKLSSARIRTTHMTGIITDIGIELGRLLYWNRSADKNIHHRVVADRSNLLIHLRIVGAFIFGGLAGAFAFSQIGFIAAFALSAWLLVLAIVPAIDDVLRWWRQS